MEIDFFINHWDKILVIIFAFLSAFFAWLSFLVIFAEYKRNNPCIKVLMNRSIIPFWDNMKEYIGCTIVNKWRRSIKIKGIKFILSKGNTLFFANDDWNTFLQGFPDFPIQLNESDSFETFITKEVLEKEFRKSNFEVKYLCFYDTIDNLYKFRIKKKYWREFFN